MNWTVLKKPGFWLAAIPTIAALLITQGAILEGSETAKWTSWVLSLVGIFGAQALPAPKAEEPPAA